MSRGTRGSQPNVKKIVSESAGLNVNLDSPQIIHKTGIPKSTGLAVMFELVLQDDLWVHSPPALDPLAQVNEWICKVLLPQLAAPNASRPFVAAAAAPAAVKHE